MGVLNLQRFKYYFNKIYMPYRIRKTRNKDCYSIYNKKTKHKFSKCSSLDNAKKQLRLLRAIQFNKNFVVYTRNKKRTFRKTRKVK